MRQQLCGSETTSLALPSTLLLAAGVGDATSTETSTESRPMALTSAGTAAAAACDSPAPDSLAGPKSEKEPMDKLGRKLDIGAAVSNVSFSEAGNKMLDLLVKHSADASEIRRNPCRPALHWRLQGAPCASLCQNRRHNMMSKPGGKG